MRFHSLLLRVAYFLSVSSALKHGKNHGHGHGHFAHVRQDIAPQEHVLAHEQELTNNQIIPASPPASITSAPSSLLSNSSSPTASLTTFKTLTTSSPLHSNAPRAVKSWASLGCFADSASARILTTQLTPAGTMSIELCQADCLALGFTYAGLEYGVQCFCGTLKSTVTSSACNMPCGGTSTTEICGGSSAMNVYQYVAPLTTTWTSVGCFVDSSSARILSTQLTPPGTMSIELCQGDCLDAGFAYAGLEYGVQCFCGASLASSSTSSACNMACGGTSTTEICGGSNAMNVYKSSAASTSTSSWSSVGCYADSSSARVLTTQLTPAGTMSIELCETQCLALGFTYAGLEYGVQCFCGTLSSSATTSTACNMACGGTSTTEICGGSNALNVYKYNGASPTVTSSTAAPTSTGWNSVGCYADSTTARVLSTQLTPPGTMSIGLCETQCLALGYIYAGLEYGVQCFCASSIASGAGSSTACNMACGGTSTTEICGGSNALNVYKYSGVVPTVTSSTAAPTSTGWNAVGCYADSTTSRVLSTQLTPPGTMSIELCETQCLALGYIYAGLEYGVQCFCASSIASGAGSSTACNMACGGTSTTEICGGSNALNVYKYSGVVPTVTSSTAAPTSTGWSSVGCYADSTTSRVLSTQLTPPGTMSVGLCETQCLALGYPYAGLEYGVQCFCGSALAFSTSSSACNMACGGTSTTEVCGGSNALNIYKYNGAIPTTTSSTAAPTSTGWSSVGCYADSTTSRVLSTQLTPPGTMSIELCETDCLALGYKYAGLEYGVQCFCGSALAFSTSSSACNMACGGTSTTQICGGSNALNIYKYNGAIPTTTSSISASASSTSAPTATATGWAKVGCYADSTSSRVLSTQLTPPGTMSIGLCETQCLALGYPYAGLEYGVQCFCGSSLASTTSSSACNMACGGTSTTEICGGSNALSVYKYTAGASTKGVFAHHLVGLTYTYTLATWLDDIQKAQAAHIDAFALNVASTDTYTNTQVAYAFQAANQTGFKLFFSFDYGASTWSTAQVVALLQSYVTNANYYTYNGLPFVSTFAGSPNASNWVAGGPIRSAIPGGLFFMPDWSDIGYGAISQSQYYNSIDGAFSWDAWPTGATNNDPTEDKGWISNLGSKPFMMAVSPWFYTNLPEYSKNWGWRGDSLLHDRWLEANTLQPQFIEIISWNDYGESHYIGPIRTDGIPSGAVRYVQNNPHDAWRKLLPYYIDYYKNGYATVSTELLVFWYRNAPAAAGSANGTVGNASWQPATSITAVMEDQINVNALIKSLDATVTVKIGTNAATTLTPTAVGMNHFTVDFNGQTGAVAFAIVRSGSAVVTATGTALLSTPTDGLANFNAWVGSS